ncbi:MAG: GntR family transcriptional regulator [bacterium]
MIKPEDIRNRRNLKDMVYQIIRQRILDNVYEPGEKLTLEQFVGEFGISRTPVKEAFDRLQTEGLVRIFPQRGTYVAELSTKEIRDIFDARIMFETYAVEEFIENFTPERRRRLERYMEALSREGAEEKDTDLEFHRYLVESSGNDDLIKLYDILAAKIRFVLIYHDANARVTREEHDRIIRSILARDVAGAKEALREHLERACSRNISGGAARGNVSGKRPDARVSEGRR